MAPLPFPNFEQFPSHHCWTGSLRHIYFFHGYPVSEEMLLGLGAGVGFIYWHMKGSLPFLGGRANFARPGVQGLEYTVGGITGVRVQSFHTSSSAKAEKRLVEMLDKQNPVLLVLDMGFLPYFDFGGEEFHFGSHVVVACGYDKVERIVLLADRDADFHPVSLDVLAQARGSTYKPFPPQHAWFEFDFRDAHRVDPGCVFGSVMTCSEGMLQPPISNMGVKGVRKAAKRIRAWPEVLEEKELRDTCMNTAIMIDARGGTGGGIFRYMYARFLIEAAEMTGVTEFLPLARQMQAAGDAWEEIAAMFAQAYNAEEPVKWLERISAALPGIAEQEERTWAGLHALAVTKVG